ncbi:MAG: hypothetical protein AAF978_05275, partial [Cyanobacteria bacterium P01_E01_bin.48]
LQNLLESGHPEVYALMARALHDGYIYEKDLLLAFAYAHLAFNQGFEFSGYWIFPQSLEGLLTLEEAAEAKEMSREICQSLPACP